MPATHKPSTAPPRPQARLTEDTAHLAQGYDAVCLFVNDDADEAVRQGWLVYCTRVGRRAAGRQPPGVRTSEGAWKVLHLQWRAPFVMLLGQLCE